jgi:hypothetical protein
MKEAMNRKKFLQQIGMLGVAGVVVPASLASCGGEEQPKAAPGTQAAASDCNDVTGLTEVEVKMRENLKYMSVSDDPAKHCDICNFWVPPEAGKECGGCTLMKGPIAAKGSCLSFAPKPANLG